MDNPKWTASNGRVVNVALQKQIYVKCSNVYVSIWDCPFAAVHLQLSIWGCP
jgi:hypothetical protein